MAAPLKLRRQITAAPAQQEKKTATDLPVAAVLVNTPVSHLEGIYDYLVPEQHSQSAVAGTKVIVPFGNTKTEGLVISRKSNSDQSRNLKVILEIASPAGMITKPVMSHVEAVRNRFGGSFWEVLKSAVPPRVIKEEKNITKSGANTSSDYSSQFLIEVMGRADHGLLMAQQRIRWALTQPIGVDHSRFLAELIKVRSTISQVLLIVPDEKDLDQISEQLINFFGDQLLILSSHLSKADRYRNFLNAIYQPPKVILATRGGSFINLAEDATVIVLSDLDNSHYEQHSPGWNSRDVSLLRPATTSLIFISASHSLEVARLIETGWLTYKKYQSKSKIRFHTNEAGRSFIPVIKSSLENGNVLVSVAEKGYANLFLCAKCRNVAACSCGGKLQILGANSNPSCYLCKVSKKDWRCNFCGEAKPYVLAKGINRTAEEIGRAIPKNSILISSGSKQLKSVPKGRHIVIATAGSEPAGSFSAVILLDGEKLFNRPSLRSEELAKFNWFSALCKLDLNSEVFLSLPNNHPVVQSILRLDSQSAALSELRGREAAKLPPYYRVAIVIGPSAEISKFTENLKSSKEYQITGPIDIEKGEKKIIIRAPISAGQGLVDLLDDVVKVQGVKGRSIFKVRFDPFDL